MSWCFDVMAVSRCAVEGDVMIVMLKKVILYHKAETLTKKSYLSVMSYFSVAEIRKIYFASFFY